MTYTKLLFSSTAILALTTSFAMANNNEAYLSQSGPDNSALIDQNGGSSNKAGRSGTGAIMQQNDSSIPGNTLTIKQRGSNNVIGSGIAIRPGAAVTTGVLQLSENPQANTATVTQRASGNEIGSISQLQRFGGSSQSGNELTILQSGSTGGNTINDVFQDYHKGANASVAIIRQTGDNNLLDRVQQYNTGSGAANRIVATFSGSNNGKGALSGLAAGSGATSSWLMQGDLSSINGLPEADNRMRLIVSGDYNQFGVTQIGRSNRVGTLEVTGSQNELGVYQNGERNRLNMSVLGGVGNIVGVTQLVDLNRADVMVMGNDNEFGVYQDGNRNDATVNVTGDYNGAASSETLGGAALTASLGSSLYETGLTKQFGNRNTVDVTFTGDNNLFGMVQDGNRNDIMGMTSGDQNQAVVVQLGNDNTASYTQSGVGNNAGIVQ